MYAFLTLFVSSILTCCQRWDTFVAKLSFLIRSSRGFRTIIILLLFLLWEGPSLSSWDWYILNGPCKHYFIMLRATRIFFFHNSLWPDHLHTLLCRDCHYWGGWCRCQEPCSTVKVIVSLSVEIPSQPTVFTFSTFMLVVRLESKVCIHIHYIFIQWLTTSVVVLTVSAKLVSI